MKKNSKVNPLVKYLHWRTIASAAWRAAVAVVDWRTHLRKIKGLPIVDVVFITNMRDLTDRLRFLGYLLPWHFNGPRYILSVLGGNFLGRTRALNIVTEDLKTAAGRAKARKYFISAVEWADRNGARVILLAASTKRLFKNDGAYLKKRFPNIVFTLGDNGTMLLLRDEVIRALGLAGLRPQSSRIAVLGAYGMLGEMMTGVLLKKGFEVVAAGPNEDELVRVGKKFGIETCLTFEAMGKVDAVVACTHSDKILLTADIIKGDLIRKNDKKLLVIDVAEPSNLKWREWFACRKVCIRQDAGNAYSPRLKYVLGALSYKMFRLTRGVTFGCFAETLSLYEEISQGGLAGANLFAVSEEMMQKVGELFMKNGFGIPTPRNFGKDVRSFELDLRVLRAKEKKPVWKLASNWLAGLW